MTHSLPKQPSLEHLKTSAKRILAALRAYLSDVADSSKSLAKCEEWFCWAAFQRLMARRCC
jgi:hypothetical protein